MAHNFTLISRVSRTWHLPQRPYHGLRRHLGGRQTLQEFSPLKKQTSTQNVCWKLENNVQGHPKGYFGKIFCSDGFRTFSPSDPLNFFRFFEKPSSFPRIFGNDVHTFSNSHNFRMVFLSPKTFVRRSYSES